MTVEVLGRAPTLDQLVETVRREHEICAGAAKATLDSATRAGEALLAIREQTMREGAWMAWVRENAPISRNQAYTYMRIATYREYIPDGVGIAEGERLLGGLPAIGGGRGRPRLPDPMKEDARRMRRGGLGYKEIAKQLGISPSTVHNWFNDSAAKRRLAASKALRQKEKASEVERAVAKAGGALAEAYAMSERLDDILGQAHREATEHEARRDLAKAHEFQRAMRDAVVRALGVES